MAGNRVVVVGAGPGGLAAAMQLARAGLDVTVLERLGRVGGRTSTLDGEDAAGRTYRFDMGPTFFLYPAVLEEVFTRCGMDLRQEVDLRRVDPQYHLVFEQGGDLRASADPQRMREQIARISPADADSFPRFMDDNRAKFERFKPILQSPFNSPLDLLRPDVLRSLSHLRPWCSVDSDLRKWFSDERIRLAFSFQSKYLGMSPLRCPSLFTILAFLEYEYGVWHPIGGCGAVSQAMADAARQLGVDIRLGEEVTEISFDGRRARAIRTSAGQYPCDALVVNADFAHAMQQLVPNHLRRRWSDRQLQRKKFSCSTFMLYLGIEGQYDQLAHHTIFLAEDYARNLREIEQDHVLSANPSLYVHNPSLVDPTLAPAGMSSLYVLAPVSHEHGNIDWNVEAEPFRSKVLAQLHKLGLRDLEGRIRYERVLTPHDWRHQMAIHRGATFNLTHSLGQMLHLRPHNRFEELDGVYLVGGGTHPGSGLPVIYQSSMISTDLLLGDLGLDAPWAAMSASRASKAAALPELVESLT